MELYSFGIYTPKFVFYVMGNYAIQLFLTSQELLKVAARIGIAVPKSIQCSIQYSIMRFSRTWTPLLNAQYIIFIFGVALYEITN